jgi:hypothetical protein
MVSDPDDKLDGRVLSAFSVGVLLQRWSVRVSIVTFGSVDPHCHAYESAIDRHGRNRRYFA